MKKRYYIYIALLLLEAVVYAVTLPEPPVNAIQAHVTRTCYPINSAEVIKLTNLERSKNGLVPLVENPLLDKGSALKAADMTANHYWSHYSPIGVSPWYWFGQAGYRYVYAGENLAQGYSNATELVQAWLISPEHRANILNPHYREIGVSSTCGSVGWNTTVTVAEYASH